MTTSLLDIVETLRLAARAAVDELRPKGVTEAVTARQRASIADAKFSPEDELGSRRATPAQSVRSR